LVGGEEMKKHGKVFYFIIICSLVFGIMVANHLIQGRFAKISDSSEPINSRVVLSGTSAFDKKYAKWALQDDFKMLQNLVESNHPKLYTDVNRLLELYSSQYDLIEDGMTELQFFRLLSPIVSVLNCGHTSINLSSEYQRQSATEGKFFPLPLRFIDNRAYIVQNESAKNIPLGSELISINGRPIQEIIETLFDNISADGQNQTRKVLFLNDLFGNLYKNYIDNFGFFEITYRTPMGTTSTSHVEGVTQTELRNIYTPPYLNRTAPYQSEFYEKYAVLTLYTFSPSGGYSLNDFESFIDTFFEQCSQKKIENLILDVRNNGGGDPRVASHLFSYLEKKEQPYFSATTPNYYTGLKDPIPFARNHYDHALYVLMNGGSFSTSGHILALLKSQNVGVFIGEESGGSYACTDSSKDFVLTHTKIQFRSSTQKWEVAAEGLIPGRGIIPDFEVIQTIEEYLYQKKDIVKQFAIDKIYEIK
jgi:hypothetical protein